MFDFLDGEEKMIRFKGRCGIYRCAEAKRELVNILDKSSSKVGVWQWDVTEIESVDFAFLQILVAFRRHIESLGGRTVILGRSQCFDTTVRLFCLEQALGLLVESESRGKL